MTTIRSTRRTRLLAAALGVVALALTGCAGNGGAAAGGMGDESGPKKVAFLAMASDSLFQSMMEGFDEADDGSVDVELISADFDPQKQLQQCQDALATGQYSGILLYPVVGSLAVPCVQDAEDLGVPVVTIDSQVGSEFLVPGEIQLSGVKGQIYVDPAVYTQGFADLTKQACDGTADCKAAYFTGPASFELVALEKEELTKKLDGIADIVFEKETGYGDVDAGATAAQELLQTGKDVQVLIVGEDVTASGAIPE
ncbi:MAG: substrate-binding domain-containing protein, partial [Microbacterium sp.]